jgi:hypothetical protein
MAGLVLGNDLQATLRRAISRVLVSGTPNLRHFSTVQDAARWIVPWVDDPAVTEASILAAYEALRPPPR